MNIVRAKEMITSLADGINPVTGEVLSEKDSCNQIEVVRALYTILNYIDTHSADSKRKVENSGKLWTPEEEEELCHRFQSGYTNKEICAYFKRSTESIASRLVRLGQISSRDEFRKRK
ncbi:hypothetical protein [Massiliimalia massiliensis]|uniref:hypothetical protein n=1 Tax=Massiliimalia massiliensis TaxID=1852384 RepID=UPI000984A11F|nr:hypothetical protein [Massiliimalia massiliensis]